MWLKQQSEHNSKLEAMGATATKFNRTAEILRSASAYLAQVEHDRRPKASLP